MIRLAVRVPRESAEVVLAELVGLAPGGVEEVDDGPVIEYAIYGAEGELPALPELEAAAGGVTIEISTSTVEDGWETRWQEFHRPVTVSGAGGELVVSPPWETTGSSGELVIDPGRAFGTGAHPTTRLCLELLLGEVPDGSCVDVGCGSGVLGIAAARLGWNPVLAIDHDPASVEAAPANARRNDVTIEARRFDLLRDGPVPGANLALANLLRPLLLALAGSGFSGMAPGTLIASGLLTGEADEVSQALCSSLEMEEAARASEGEWAALLLRAS